MSAGQSRIAGHPTRMAGPGRGMASWIQSAASGNTPYSSLLSSSASTSTSASAARVSNKSSVDPDSETDPTVPLQHSLKQKQEQAPYISILSSLYTSHSSLDATITNKNNISAENPNSLIASTTRRHLNHATSLALLGGPSAQGYGSKPCLLLACPHPGAAAANGYIEEVVKRAACSAGAGVLVLDYLSVVEMVGQVALWRRKLSGSDGAGDKTDGLREDLSLGGRGQRHRFHTPAASRSQSVRLALTPSFSPSHYRPYTPKSGDETTFSEEDDEEGVDEEYEDEEDEEDDHHGRSNNNSGGGGVGRTAGSAASVRWREGASRGGATNIVFVPVNGSSSGTANRATAAAVAAQWIMKGLQGSSRSGRGVGDGGNGGDNNTNASDPTAESTHYHTQLNPADLDVVLRCVQAVATGRPYVQASASLANGGAKSLPESVTASPVAASRSRRTIILLKDTTETLEAAGESGKRLVSGLLDIIKQSRRQQATSDIADTPRVALITSCTPSVLKTHAKVDLDASVEFYRTLYSGKVVHVTDVDDEDDGDGLIMDLDELDGGERGLQRQPFLLADADGVLFRTCLDGAAAGIKSDFEKIIIPPPSPSVVALSSSSTTTTATAAAAAASLSSVPSSAPDSHSAQEQYNRWLRAMEISHCLRNRELNWRNILIAARDRGATMASDQGLRVGDVLTCRNQRLEVGSGEDISVDEHAGTHSREANAREVLLKELDGDVWTLEKVNRLVGLAIGCRLGSTATVGSASTISNTQDRHVVELEWVHFAEALELIREMTRYAEKLELDGVVEKEDVVQDNTGVVAGNATHLWEGSTNSSGGGSAAVSNAGTVFTEKDGTIVKNSAAGQSVKSSSTNQIPPETDKSRLASLKKQLSRQGHKLNSYETKLLSTVISPDNIPVHFSDLILPSPTKLMLQTLVSLPLLQPHHFQTGILSRHAISGVLLFGPPGTGKTMLAKALARSSGAKFMAVSLSNIFDKYVGEGEKNTRAIFTLARKLSPCVVFLDEVDALFGARRGVGDGMHSSKREIINEFMSEWDGVSSAANRGVMILGATNRPFDLDDAVLRRMPRRVFVDLPDERARELILGSHLKDEVLSPDVDLARLAVRTHHYSGSDLKNLCVSAALNSVKESVARSILKTEGDSGSVGGGPMSVMSTEEVLKYVEGIDSWMDVLVDGPAVESTAHTSSTSMTSVSPSPSSSSSSTTTTTTTTAAAAIITPTTTAPSTSTSTSSLSGFNQTSSASTSSALAQASTELSLVTPAPTQSSTVAPSRQLNAAHFEAALKQVPPSLTDETQTLIELKKWDDQYGEGAARRKGAAKKGWGFHDVSSETTLLR